MKFGDVTTEITLMNCIDFVSIIPLTTSPKLVFVEVEFRRPANKPHYCFSWGVTLHWLMQRETLIIFLVGLSLTISYAHALGKRQSHQFSKYFWRGLKIFGWGLVITAGTYFFIGRGFVIFGILHLIGVAIILGGLFLPLNKWLTLSVGAALILLGIYLDSLVVDYPWLIWLGLKQQGTVMVDYYPVAPWAGIALVGIFAGHAPF